LLKVIGAGFGRTGTLSLKNALELLGYGPCYHMVEVRKNPDHLALWQAAGDGAPMNWEDIYRHYQSAVDWPTSAFYKQLMHYYPDAQVILTVRPALDWHRSVLNTIARPEHIDEMDPDAFTQMTRTIIWNGVFDGRIDDPSYAPEVFARHIADVQKTVPADRLLIYDAKDGWEPLCQFLGVPVPEATPYPYLNTTQDWERRAAESPS